MLSTKERKRLKRIRRRNKKKRAKAQLLQVARTGMHLGGAAIGAATGLGPALGSQLGSLAGSVFGSITGMGDYKVHSNSLMSGGPPVFLNAPPSVRFPGKEYIADIITSADGLTFKNNTFSINPGDATTFPWLSQIAQGFTQYRFHGLVFYFKSNSADAIGSTNTALGSVVMATDYNVLDRPFPNKTTMEVHEFCAAGKPSEDIIHPIECDPKRTTIENLYVRNNDSGQSDRRFHDLGLFQIATVGQQAESVVGELWVSYDIEFFKRSAPSTFGSRIPTMLLGGSRDYDNFVGPSSGEKPAASCLIMTDLSEGVSVEEYLQSSIYLLDPPPVKTTGGGLLTSPTTTTCTFRRPGCFLATLYVEVGAGETITDPTRIFNGFTAGEIEEVDVWDILFNNDFVQAGDASQQMMIQQTFKVYHHMDSNHDNTLQFNTLTLTTATQTVQTRLFITEVNDVLSIFTHAPSLEEKKTGDELDHLIKMFPRLCLPGVPLPSHANPSQRTKALSQLLSKMTESERQKFLDSTSSDVGAPVTPSGTEKVLMSDYVEFRRIAIPK